MTLPVPASLHSKVMRRNLLKTCNFLVTQSHVFKLCNLVYISMKFENNQAKSSGFSSKLQYFVLITSP